MEVGESKCSSGYSKPPWIFRGRALYQLHLVKAETARACIPKEFRLVEAFGYTLGGFFLASYDDSPVGVFDELVVIAGIVWNRPTSCAWAAKVLVNSVEACDHGRKEVGLPSRVAKFSKIITETPRHRKSNGGFLNLIGMNSDLQSKENQLDVKVCEVNSSTATDVCNINISTHVPLNTWMGPEIKMSLPSYSGHTEHTPDLLKYSCRIQCRVRAVEPAKVSVLSTNETDDSMARKTIDDERNLSLCVMLSKPVLAFEMSSMKMQVEAPRVVSHFFKQRSDH